MVGTELQIHDYETAVASLMGRINYEQTVQIPYRSRAFKLQRMERLLALVGNPHWRLPAIHIAGTKGKGSTAAMTESILRAAGYRTGLYTSPHLERIEERFAIAGIPCSSGTFVEAFQTVATAVEELDRRFAAEGRTALTYFEMTTAIAMLIFARANVDFAVLEVGLGGRLDSTNVCRPLVSVITSISYDHTQQLGNTLSSIAGEKAGIIKPGVPVISGALAAEAADVIRLTAKKKGSPIYQQNVDFGVADLQGDRFAYWQSSEGRKQTIRDLSVAMEGEHQMANASLAITAVRQLDATDFNVTEDAIRSGLAEARCPARVEIIRQSPPIILDAAHNVASCAALVAAIERRFPNRRRTLILATSSDKDSSGMLEALLPAFDCIVFTRYLNNPRGADPSDLLARATAILTTRAAENGARSPVLHQAASPAEALAATQRQLAVDELLCISGSFFLAAEVRPLLRELFDYEVPPELGEELIRRNQELLDKKNCPTPDVS